MRIRPYMTLDKKIDGAVMVLVDIEALKRTEQIARETQRALEKALVYADDIIATLREPFVVLNADLRVKTANRSFYDSFHVSKGETENQLVYDLGNGQWDIPVLRTLLEQVLSRNESVHDFEVEHTFPALGRKTMLLNARPFPPDSKHPELILLAVEDVSAVRERANELATANRRKDEFLAMLSHELRSPLAPIRNSLEIMNHAGGDALMIENARVRIERQTNKLVQLVDDLMDISRISTGKVVLRKRDVNLCALIKEVVESIQTVAQYGKHDISITLPDSPIHLDADPLRLSQIIGNVVSNACKYTDPDGKIAVKVEEDEHSVLIRVKDTGIGIAAEMLPQVFDKFTQIDSSLERTRGGLGLGLSIVQSLIQMHDGTVEAFSPGLNKGSEFVLRIPIVQGAKLPTSTSLPALGSRDVQAPAKKRKILVADDNIDSAESLALLLTLDGHEVRTVFDGFDAVATAEAFKPDVVFMDIGMPRLSGYDAARAIRKGEWGRTMVLVALTGWGQEHNRKNAFEAGFNQHLVKPADIADVRRMIATLK